MTRLLTGANSIRAVIPDVSAVAERLRGVLRVKTGPDDSEIEGFDAPACAARVERQTAEAGAA